ncbi:MAG: L,D-transpeptidase [Actinomycetota bacterium]
MQRRHFLLGAGALGLTACAQPERQLLDEWSGQQFTLEPGGPRTTTTTTTTTVPAADDTVAPVEAESPYPVDVPEEDLPGLSFVAEAVVPLVTVTGTPGGDDVLFQFENPIPSGGPLVFLVEEFDGLENLRVLLPTRPNGSFGWIRGTELLLTRHNYSIQVRLDDFLLVLFERGIPIFETTVGVARDNAPTPLGRYYTTELLRPPRPDTLYGAYAYGLSGYSEVLTEFAGGDGQLGIHGTNDPSTLGTNVSSGCIRLHNDDISLLVEEVGLPVGVPVEVV